MKKIIRLTVALLFVLTASAIHVNAQGIMVGGKFGLNMGSLKHPTLKYTAQPGVELGLVFEAAVNDLFSLQPEVSYLLQRAEVEGGDVSIHSFEVPILFKFSTGDNWRWFGNLGPTLGVTTEVSGSGVFTAFQEEFPEADFTSASWNDYYVTHNIGFVIGAGVAIDNILIDARYNAGLSNISKTEASSLSTSRFTLSAAYILVF